MRNINFWGENLSVDEYVKAEICKNAGTQSLAFKEQLVLYAILPVLSVMKKRKKKKCLNCLSIMALNISNWLKCLE